LLDAADEALVAVSLLVKGLVVGMLALAMAPWWDDGVATLVDGLLVEPVGIVSFVGDDVLGGQTVDQVAGGRHVVLLAGSQDQPDRQAQSIYADMELGSEATARAAKRLGVLSPLFLGAPAA
jgi:hypothetical protein